MIIKGKKVILRAIEQDDLPLLLKWANDPDICSMVGGWHFPINTNDQKKWFESLSLNSVNQRFAIDSVADGLIGTANLVDINWKDRNAFHGILLGETAIRGKGYAADAIMAIMKYAFEELGLNRLDTTIIEYNTPSYSLYTQKCGWKKEGVQKDWYFRSNRFWDRIMVGVTKADYITHIGKINE